MWAPVKLELSNVQFTHKQEIATLLCDLTIASNKVKAKSVYGEFMGIHYDYKSKRGERAMLKEAKRKARLAQRRAKRLTSSGSEEKEEIKTHDIKKIITQDDITNPNQKKNEIWEVQQDNITQI